jgi:hypothetical protein
MKVVLTILKVEVGDLPHLLRLVVEYLVIVRVSAAGKSRGAIPP